MLKRIKIVKLISIGGLLTSLAVMFQSAPIFIPLIGLALSPFSTLPIAIAAAVDRLLGITVLCSSALILIIVNPQEAIILIFTTGLLGIVLGSLVYRKGALISILSSAISLSLGMIILTYIAAVPAFVEFTETIKLPIAIGIFIIFSLVYVSVWFLCLRKLAKYLNLIKRIESVH